MEPRSEPPRLPLTAPETDAQESSELTRSAERGIIYGMSKHDSSFVGC